MAKKNSYIFLRYTTTKGLKIPVLFYGKSAWLRLEDLSRLFDVEDELVKKLFQGIVEVEGEGKEPDSINVEEGKYQGKFYNMSISMRIGRIVAGKESTEFNYWAWNIMFENEGYSEEEFHKVLERFVRHNPIGFYERKRKE